MRSLIKNIYVFYRYDCCWPYSVSFFLALIIFWLDFFIEKTRYCWASPVVYGVILAYFLHIVHLYFQNKIEKKNLKFFIVFLSAKAILWGILLALLYAVR